MCLRFYVVDGNFVLNEVRNSVRVFEWDAR